MILKHTTQLKSSVLASSMIMALVSTTNSYAFNSDVTLIQISDIHGSMVSHSGTIHHADGTESFTQNAGGLAKIKTVIDDIKSSNPDNLVINVGDMTHGTAETMFTVGDAIMPGLNALGIDVSVPGNWDFGYGPAVFRSRFTALPSDPVNCFLPPNIRLMSDSEGVPCVTKATFPNIANNLYNNAADLPSPPLPSPPGIPAAAHNMPVLPPFMLFDVGGVSVAVIGITASIVPEQADVFNIGLRFTQGINELPGNIAAVQGLGAQVIVVASELGLSQNIQIGRDFKDIDVVLSGHTHEITHGAIIAHKNRVLTHNPANPNSTFRERRLLRRGGTIVVEAGEDFDIGKLELEVGAGGVVDYRWNIVLADDAVTPDPVVAALVNQQEAQFIASPGFHPHVLMPAGFCGSPDPAQNPLGLDPCFVPNPAVPGTMMPNPLVMGTRGLWLTESLDSVVGSTNVLLRRHDDIEEVWNNVIADAIHSVTNGVTTVDVAMTGGFRFGYDILSASEGGSGDITLRDLYSHFPIAPAVVMAEFSGKAIEDSLEHVLDSVFNQNPYQQKGGWYMGLSNMSQKIDLENAPYSTSSGRIVQTTIGMAPLGPAKRYSFASCYAHGNSLDNVCRTPGGSGHMFFELTDRLDYSSTINLVAPVNTTGIIQGPNVKQVAPNAFLSPVHVLRRFLDSNGPINEVDFAVGRVVTVDSTVFPPAPVASPVSAIMPDAIQLPEGSGSDLVPDNTK